MNKRECFTNDAELYLYLDNELNEKRRLLLDDHLKTCSHCRVKHYFNYGLKSIIQSGVASSAPERLRISIFNTISQAELSRESRPKEILRGFITVRPLVAGVTLVCAVLVISAAIMFRANIDKHDSLANLLVSEYNEHLDGLNTEHGIFSTNIDEVRFWIENNIEFTAKFPDNPKMPLSGACTLDENGMKIACLFFGYDSEKITLFMLRADISRIDCRRTFQVKDRTLHCGECTDRTYIAWSEGDQLRILVGKLPEESLVKLAGDFI